MLAMTVAHDLQKLIFPQGGQYLYGALAGPSQASKRKAIMDRLGESLPKSKCGYTLVFGRLCKEMDITDVYTVSEKENRILEILHYAATLA